MKKLTTILFLAALSISWVHAGSNEVGTQFTYQGELLDNGSPANDSYDVLIQLYSDALGGSPIDFVSFQDMTVTDGLISVDLDYGDLPFMGDEMFLQINIRPATSTGNLEPLLPRQRINVTPYAIQATFSDGSESPWQDITGGINYDQNVIVGNAGTSTSSKLTVDANASQSPLRAKINGSTKLMVRENGGTQVGTVGSVTPNNPGVPANGLFIQGNATQPLISHGFVKAGTEIDCGAGLSGGSDRFFNNVNTSDFVTTSNGAAGGCTITAPFDISNSFFNVSAQGLGGVTVFETVVASCSVNSATQIRCQLHLITGGNTSAVNGTVQLLFY